MAFSYSVDLDDAVSRVRFAVGDIASPGLLPDETYEALLAVNVNSESKAIRQSAAALAARYATQPSSVSSNGSSVTWGERIAQWRLIASGKGGGVASGIASGVTIRGVGKPDYTLADGDETAV